MPTDPEDRTDEGAKDPDPNPASEEKGGEDEVEDQSKESFPASDPPSY